MCDATVTYQSEAAHSLSSIDEDVGPFFPLVLCSDLAAIKQ